MTFIFLTFFAAFGIEGIGTYVSVIGLSTLFGANPIIIALAVALDLGKLLVVSLLYTHWKKLNFLMKSYALVAAAVTMIITSAGAAGYLSGEFQKAILGTQEISLKVDVLKEEQAKLEARKKQIDDQIANLPSNYSRSRVTLMKQFEDEQKTITSRLSQIQEELPQQQLAQIGTEAKAGPILYIAKAFDISVEEAVKWVILMIIFVFDPLAVFLIIAGNFLLHLRRTHSDTSIGDADLFDDGSGGTPVPPAPSGPVMRKATLEEVVKATRAGEVLAPTVPVHVHTVTPDNEMYVASAPKQSDAPAVLANLPHTSTVFPEEAVEIPKKSAESLATSSLSKVRPDAFTDAGNSSQPRRHSSAEGVYTGKKD